MAGLVPSIHVFGFASEQDVDARHKAGHDAVDRTEPYMSATLLDSDVFKDIFTTPERRRVFSDEFRVACYLEIEAALAKVQGRLGIIPQEAADEIVKKCKVENIDFKTLKAATE